MTAAEIARRSRRILNSQHHHEDAMWWADGADATKRLGDHEKASRFYGHAFVYERRAADLVVPYLDAVTNVRSGVAWKKWVEELAEYDAEQRRGDPNISETIDKALVLYAREIGFGKVAPKR